MLIAAKLEIVPGVPVPNPGTIRGAGTIKAAPLLHLDRLTEPAWL
jgi:hypothetical protein